MSKWTTDSGTTHPSPATLSLYHDGEGPEFLLHEVKEHLAACEECRAQVEQFNRITDAFDLAPLLEAPRDLTAAVKRHIEDETRTLHLRGAQDADDAAETLSIPVSASPSKQPHFASAWAALLMIGLLTGSWVYFEYFATDGSLPADEVETAKTDEARNSFNQDGEAPPARSTDSATLSESKEPIGTGTFGSGHPTPESSAPLSDGSRTRLAPGRSVPGQDGDIGQVDTGQVDTGQADTGQADTPKGNPPAEPKSGGVEVTPNPLAEEPLYSLELIAPLGADQEARLRQEITSLLSRKSPKVQKRPQTQPLLVDSLIPSKDVTAGDSDDPTSSSEVIGLSGGNDDLESVVIELSANQARRFAKILTGRSDAASRKLFESFPKRETRSRGRSTSGRTWIRIWVERPEASPPPEPDAPTGGSEKAGDGQ